MEGSKTTVTTKTTVARTVGRGLRFRQTVLSCGGWAVLAFGSAFFSPGALESPFPPAMIAALPVGYGAAALCGGLAAAFVRLIQGGPATTLLSVLLAFGVRLLGEHLPKLRWLLLTLGVFTAACLTGADTDAATWVIVLSAAYYAAFCLGIYRVFRPFAEQNGRFAALLADPSGRFVLLLPVFAALGAGTVWTVGGLAVSSVIGVFLLICLTRRTAPFYAAACGAVCGLLLGAAREQPMLSAALALGCLTLAAVPWSDKLRSGGFLAASVAVLFIFPIEFDALVSVYELSLATLLAACVPPGVLTRIGAAVRAPAGEIRRPPAARGAAALSDVFLCLRGDFTEACRKLDRLKCRTDPPDRVAESVCSGCREKNRCYNLEYDRTVLWLTGLAQSAKQGQLPPEPPVPCERAGHLYEAFRRYYRDDTPPSEPKLLARQTVREELGLLADVALAAVQLEAPGQRYPSLEEHLSRHLRRLGTETLSVFATADGGRVEAVLTVTTQLDRERLHKLRGILCEYCGLRFPEPSQKPDADGWRITCRSTPKIELQYGCAQLPAAPENCCGDCLLHSESRDGRELFLLCDGMGTGSDAAVDGTIAASFFSRLFENGATPDIALRVANSVLSVRADTESLSTLDAVIIDVYRARARLLKAGAFTTLLLHGGSILRFEGSSLPIGIMESPDYSDRELRLTKGDVLLMASDGVADEDWLAAKLLGRGEMSPTAFCEAVAFEAHSRQSRPDDVSVAMITVG